MTTATQTKKQSFLTEWTPDQFKGMERKIAQFFSGKPMSTHHGNYPAMFLNWIAISDRLGLAYTSSSSCAGYWICNTEVYSNEFPDYQYIGFALGTNRRPYAILQDKEENEKIIELK